MQWHNLIPLIDNSLSSEDLSGERGSLMIVGDPKQSIYRWRGGKAEQFIHLSKENTPFSNKDVKAYNLETNYRSFDEIITFNNQFFSFLASKFQNTDYLDLYQNQSFQKSNSKKGGYVNVSFLPEIEKGEVVDNETDEENSDLDPTKNDLYLAKTIQTSQEIRAKGFKDREIVILTRNNKSGVLLANYLTENNINIISAESLLIDASSEVKFLLHFLKYIANKKDKEALANSLLAQAKSSPDNFAMLATTNSDDQGSKNNGGEYDNITPGQMVPTFNDYVFNNAVGSIGLVETDFGYHVIKVTGKYDAVLLGTVAQKIEPSETTIDAIYTEASKFESDANENKDFEALAKKAKVEVIPATNIKAFDEFIQGIGSQREMVRWSFNGDSNVGDIKRFDIPQGFVIAKLKEKNESGLLPLDLAKQSIEPILKNQKKAELIKKKMNGT
jgi:parvulin-like peptidyl-prolyl isomerase